MYLGIFDVFYVMTAVIKEISTYILSFMRTLRILDVPNLDVFQNPKEKH